MRSDLLSISYGLATAAYSFLAVLLVTGWRGRLPGGLLIVATVVSALWALAVAVTSAWSPALLPVASLFEVARYAAWFAFLGALLPQPGVAPGADAGPRPGLDRWRVTVVVLPLLAGLAIEMAVYLGWLDRSASLYLAFRVILATLGLVLIEQVYRNLPQQNRWNVKFLCLGLGGAIAFDLYVFAEAMLFQRIEPDAWIARGAVNALAVPLIAIAAARTAAWSLDVAVSRNVVFHSAALLGVGVYLLVMGAAGYYIRFFGGTWGTVLQTLFVFGAVLLLLALLFSGMLRARLRVLVGKHFFSYRFDYREEWLRFTRTLAAGEPGVKLNERAIAAIGGLVESPGGVLFMRDEHGDSELIAEWNLRIDAGSHPAAPSLMRFLAERQWVVSLEEYRAEPERYSGLELPPWLMAATNISLIVPLILHEQLIGYVVLATPRIPLRINWEVIDLLKVAGRQAAGYLAHLRAAQQLLIARQFESFNRMSAFVIHDLKNLVAQLSLLVANAAKHKDNPEFQEDMLMTVDNAVSKMNKLLAHLRSGTVPVDKPVAVDLADVIARALAEKSAMKPKPSVEVVESGLRAVAHRERLERVIGHLIQNAIEATTGDGRVWVRLAREAGNAVIEVGDTGRGMTAQFVRERLFRPFETTKHNGMGIGTFESRQYVREIGGSLEVESEPEKGTRFRIVLPLPASASVLHGS